jgi:hypothetical protein
MGFAFLIRFLLILPDFFMDLRLFLLGLCIRGNNA